MTGEFVDLLFGNTDGYVALAFGRQPHRNAQNKYHHQEWQELRFAWPTERNTLLRVVEQELSTGDPVDVYMCPAKRLTDARNGFGGKKGSNAAPANILWTDLDDDVDQAKLDGLDAVVANSGQLGHLHVYVLLDAYIPVARHRALNKALAEYLGGDHKWADDTLLRLPGTLNHKTDPPAPVQVVKEQGRRWPVKELEQLLGVEPGAADAGQTRTRSASFDGDLEPVPDPLPRWVRTALDNTDIEDRSKAHARVVGACLDAGLTLGQTVAVCSTYPPSTDKYGDRLADEVLRFWQKKESVDENNPGSTPAVRPAPSNPMGVARELILEHTEDGCRTLRRWRGGWMRYQGTHWAEVESTEISAWLYQRLEHAEYTHVDPRTGVSENRPWRPNRNKIAHVLDTVTAITHLPEKVNTPSWQDGPVLAPAKELVACRNGLLEVTTKKLHPLTPTYFNLVSVPFDYQPEVAPPSRWLAFLEQLWPADPDSITALQEYFGYILSGRTDIHKIMLLVGPTRSGKGTIARVLESLVGDGNYQGPTLASLATNFGLAPLIGVPLAVVSDARLSAKDNAGQIVERLLSISGEDVLTIDRKHREQWTGKLPTRFLVLSNELPRLGDASGAIANRFLVLAMHNSFLGKEDTQLTGKLLAELPSILNWSLDGLERLARRGSFTVPQSSDEAVTALHDLISPMSAFVRDTCEIGGSVALDVMYRAWSWWAESNGHRPGSAQTFGRDLRAVLPALKVTQPRVNGVQVRHFVGVRLSSGDARKTGSGEAA